MVENILFRYLSISKIHEFNPIARLLSDSLTFIKTIVKTSLVTWKASLKYMMISF